MNKFLNNWYKNHALIYKVLLFLVTTLLIVYLFPKSGKFKYSFEKGKPWQSENLYAPFDFAIRKSSEELTLEREEINKSSIAYFNRSANTKTEVLNNYKLAFDKQFLGDSLLQKKKQLYDVGETVLNDIYTYGILSEDYGLEENKQSVILEGRLRKETVVYSSFSKQDTFKSKLESELTSNGMESYYPRMLSVFF